MSKIFILLFMIMMHIVDDYYLQGVLAKMKQKSWWKENAPQSMYKYDYIIALLMHAFSWGFCIMLPIAFYTKFNISIWFVIVFFINVIIHAFVDDQKANKKKLNLIQDQLIHMGQILVTYFMLIMFEITFIVVR